MSQFKYFGKVVLDPAELIYDISQFLKIRFLRVYTFVLPISLLDSNVKFPRSSWPPADKPRLNIDFFMFIFSIFPISSEE